MDGFRKSDATFMRTAWELSAGLFSFVVAIGIGYWFGSFLDRRLGTSPWFLAVFVLFGLVAGVLNVYRTVSGAIRSPDSTASSSRSHKAHEGHENL